MRYSRYATIIPKIAILHSRSTTATTDFSAICLSVRALDCGQDHTSGGCHERCSRRAFVGRTGQEVRQLGTREALLGIRKTTMPTLTEAEFKATMQSPMTDVTAAAYPVIDIWPYVASVAA